MQLLTRCWIDLFLQAKVSQTGGLEGAFASRNPITIAQAHRLPTVCRRLMSFFEFSFGCLESKYLEQLGQNQPGCRSTQLQDLLN